MSNKKMSSTLDIEVNSSIYRPQNLPYKINTLEDYATLQQILAIQYQMKGFLVLYRGLSNISFKLLTSLCRKQKDIPNLKEIETKHFLFLKELCKQQNYEKYKLDSFNEDLFYLSIGRHFGYACRLLDWSTSIDVSMAFACKDNENINGVLWIMLVNHRKLESSSPFDIQDDDVHLFKEDYYTPDNEIDFPLGILRRFRQNGVFSATKLDLINKPLDKILPKKNLQKVIITSKFKKIYLQQKAKDYIQQQYYVDQNDHIITAIQNMQYQFI